MQDALLDNIYIILLLHVSNNTMECLLCIIKEGLNLVVGVQITYVGVVRGVYHDTRYYYIACVCVLRSLGGIR